jgi:hypothetical protein
MKRIALVLAVIAGALSAPAAASSLTPATHFSCDDTHVVVGMPGAHHGAGAVEARTNYSTSKIQLLRDGSGVLATTPSQAGAGFGSSIAAGSINTDCHDDLAVGIPDLTVDGVPDAGGVQLLFGDSKGFVAGPLITRDTPNVPGDPEPDEHFGTSALITPGVNKTQGTTSLIIGIPGAAVTPTDGSAIPGAGQVLELRYAPRHSDELPAATPYVYDQGDGIDGQPVAGARLGASLGQIANGLAVGAPDETVNGKAAAGFWGFINGDHGFFSYGTSFTGTQSGEHLGASIAGGGGPDTDDFVVTPMVGAPGMTVHGHANAGAVAYYEYQEDEVPGLFGPQLLTQASPGVPGKVATGDHFGADVADAGGEGAIGVPGQTIKGHKGAGGAVIIDTDEDSPPLYTEVSQATKHIVGHPEAGDHFGQSVGYIESTSDGVVTASALVIGDPGEDLGKTKNAGAVEIVHSSGSSINTRQSTMLTRPHPTANYEYGASLTPNVY